MAGRQFVVCAVLAMLACSVAAGASAQGTTGTITGMVMDNTKGVMPGVTVTASGPALMGLRTGVSGDDGSYRITQLPPGVYKVTFELEGFGTITREGIQISVGFTATINVELNPAGLSGFQLFRGEAVFQGFSDFIQESRFHLRDVLRRGDG